MSDDWSDASEREPKDATADTPLFTSVGRRLLAPHERASLRRRARLLDARVGLLVVAFPFVLFFALALGTLMDEPSAFARGLGTSGMVLGLGGCVALVIVGRSWLIESGAVRRDACLGYVEQFEGVLSEPQERDGWMEQLLTEGLLARDAAGVQRLEVLPTSGYLWQANGSRLRRWYPARPTRFIEVAETPAFAAIAAEWVEPAVDDPSGLHAGERELTGDEVRELKRSIRRQRIQHARVALPLSLWFGTVLWLCLQTGRFPSGYQWVMFIGLGVVTVAWDILLVACLIRTRRLAQDARIGRVVIARFADESAEGGTPALTPPVEVLPVSGAEWTTDGHPAAWRVTGEG